MMDKMINDSALVSSDAICKLSIWLLWQLLVKKKISTIYILDGLIQYEFITYKISSCDTCYVKNLFKNKQRICGYKLYKNT